MYVVGTQTGLRILDGFNRSFFTAIHEQVVHVRKSEIIVVSSKLDSVFFRVRQLLLCELKIIKVVDLLKFFARRGKYRFCFYGSSEYGTWALKKFALQGVSDLLDERQLSLCVVNFMCF